MPDSFAAIAVALRQAASERAFALARAHQLAGEIGPQSPGLDHTVRTMAADVRMLLSAHLLFRRLAEDEPGARFALGIGCAVEDEVTCSIAKQSQPEAA